MELLERFLPRTEFESYEDFLKNYTVNVPDDFNFGFDVVDAWAEIDDQKPALAWCNDEGNDRTYTFGEIKRMSNQAANLYRSLGVRKGDTVLLMLKQRVEVWVCNVFPAGGQAFIYIVRESRCCCHFMSASRLAV